MDTDRDVTCSGFARMIDSSADDDLRYTENARSAGTCDARLCAPIRGNGSFVAKSVAAAISRRRDPLVTKRMTTGMTTVRLRARETDLRRGLNALFSRRSPTPNPRRFVAFTLWRGLPSQAKGQGKPNGDSN